MRVLIFLLISNVCYGQFVFGSRGAIKSTVNSTTSLLSNGAVFTGVGEINDYTDMMVTVSSDKTGLLQVQVSEDNVSYSTIGSYRYRPGGQNRPHVFVKGWRYSRVLFTNDSGYNQSSFSLNTHYGNFKQLNVPSNGTIVQDADAIVTRHINDNEIVAGRVDGVHMFNKFGRNFDADPGEDINASDGVYAGFPTSSPEEFQVLSTSVLDAVLGTGARTVRVYYLNDNYEMFDSLGNQYYVDVNLNGLTPVNTGVTGMRVWRVKVIDSGSTLTNQGDITVRWATTVTTVFTTVPSGIGQSQIGSFTIPAGYTGYLDWYEVNVNDNTSNRGNVSIKARDFGTNTFRLIQPIVIATDFPGGANFPGGMKLDEKTDFTFHIEALSSANADISVRFPVRIERN